MNILLIGSGGREHAILKAIEDDSRIDKIFAIPGNGAMTDRCECVSDIKATDIEKIIEFAKNHPIDFAIVAPDDPLALGLVDRLEEIGIKSFGPNKDAAQIEASKAFAKDLMKKYDIPTAEFEIFDNVDKALEYIEEKGAPIVIKADGLALGKGVTVALTKEEAKNAVIEAMKNKLSELSDEAFEASNIKPLTKQIQKETGIKGRNLFMPIRIAVSGQMHGPELPLLIEVLGKEKAINHIEQVMSQL